MQLGIGGDGKTTCGPCVMGDFGMVENDVKHAVCALFGAATEEDGWYGAEEEDDIQP